MVPGNSWRNLGVSVPVYVSRPNSNGVKYVHYFPLWFSLVASMLLIFNVVLWGSIGVFVAVKTIIEAVV